MKTIAIVQAAVFSVLLLGSANANGPCTKGSEKGCMAQGYKTCEQKHPHNVDTSAWPVMSGPTSCEPSKKLMRHVPSGKYFCFCTDLAPVKKNGEDGGSSSSKQGEPSKVKQGEPSTGKQGEASKGKKGESSKGKKGESSKDKKGESGKDKKGKKK